MIGNRIKTTRKSLRITQKELAQSVGVTQTAISKWESDTDQPKGKNLDKLAKKLGVSSEWILHGGKEKGARQNVTIERPVPFQQYSDAPLYDRGGLALFLEGKPCKPVSNIPSIAIPDNLMSPRVFAFVEDMDGLSPLISKKDHVFISPELPLKPDSNSMFWVNGSPIIGVVTRSPMGLTLKFISQAPGWEPVKIEEKDYIGRVIAIDPLWAREQRL